MFKNLLPDIKEGHTLVVSSLITERLSLIKVGEVPMLVPRRKSAEGS